MNYRSIELNWNSNGRTLPTHSEREAMTEAAITAAQSLAAKAKTPEELEDLVWDELLDNAEHYGFTGNAAAVLAGCSIFVRV